MRNDEAIEEAIEEAQAILAGSHAIPALHQNLRESTTPDKAPVEFLHSDELMVPPGRPLPSLTCRTSLSQDIPEADDAGNRVHDISLERGTPEDGDNASYTASLRLEDDNTCELPTMPGGWSDGRGGVW
jgi:hypothetical protein